MLLKKLTESFDQGTIQELCNRIFVRMYPNCIYNESG